MTVQELVEELSGVTIGGGGDLPVLVHPESGEADNVEPIVDHVLQEWPKDRIWIFRKQK